MRKISKDSYLPVVYPKRAFIAYILIMSKQGFNFFLPLNEVFADFDLICPYTKVMTDHIGDEVAFVPPARIVFPIRLFQKVPLKKQYWTHPTSEFAKTDRINNFVKPLQNYHFQKLLVVPLRKGNSSILRATRCFNIHAKQAEISFFMSENYLSMDERAQYGALYLFENPFRFELETGKRIQILDTSSVTTH